MVSRLLLVTFALHVFRSQYKNPLEGGNSGSKWQRGTTSWKKSHSKLYSQSGSSFEGKFNTLECEAVSVSSKLLLLQKRKGTTN